MSRRPSDLTQAWLTVRTDDESNPINATRLLAEIRFELKNQLEETKRARVTEAFSTL
jgi:hypothetical protein